MTMLAILRLSNGLNALGDLEILRVVDRGDSVADENCPYGERRRLNVLLWIGPRLWLWLFRC